MKSYKDGVLEKCARHVAPRSSLLFAPAPVGRPRRVVTASNHIRIERGVGMRVSGFDVDKAGVYRFDVSERDRRVYPQL